MAIVERRLNINKQLLDEVVFDKLFIQLSNS